MQSAIRTFSARSVLGAGLCVLVLTWCVPDVAAQESDGSNKEQFQRWLKYYAKVAAAYDIRLSSDEDVRLEVTPKPVMTWSQPTTQQDAHGAFFLWTHRGRPEAIASLWSEDLGNGTRSVIHSFHSLATVPLSPVRIGNRTWSPVSGIELTPVPDAPPPKESAALRLAQMRLMAERFTGFSTPHGDELRLRTLRQPLYRYESEVPEILDGAVFGMFKDWDPEILLLFEASKINDDFIWHYSVARFNGCPMRLELEGSDVWNVSRVPSRMPEVGDPRSTYYSLHRVEVRSAVIKDEELK